MDTKDGGNVIGAVSQNRVSLQFQLFSFLLVMQLLVFKMLVKVNIVTLPSD